MARSGTLKIPGLFDCLLNVVVIDVFPYFDSSSLLPERGKKRLSQQSGDSLRSWFGSRGVILSKSIVFILRFVS